MAPKTKKTSRKTATKPPKTTTITKDGLFISRKMRRDAEVAAKSEADLKQLEADDAADAQDAQAYAAQVAGQTDAERAFNAEKAQAQATAEARKKYKLEDPKPAT
jgi:hypothetical protein